MWPFFLVDTNLLVLLGVGATYRALITRHKNTSRFRPADHDRLVRVLRLANQIVITPNIATETSNLLRQITAPYDSQLSQIFGRRLGRLVEVAVTSVDAATDSAYAALGWADAATLKGLLKGGHLLTTDTALYVMANARGLNASHFDRLQPELT